MCLTVFINRLDIVFQENAFEIVACKMAAILSWFLRIDEAFNLCV